MLLGMAAAGVSSALLARPGEQGSRSNSSDEFSVVRFGTHRDGVHLDTRAIQATIDTCAKAGGGTVHFPPGRYLSGMLFLRSHVRLFLEAGSILQGSKHLLDYPVTTPGIRSYTDNYCDKSLFYGEDLEDVVLEGQGVIDGQGAGFSGPYKNRPFMIRMVHCRNISVSGLTLADSPMWVQHYLACREVYIRGIRVQSRVRPNNDGIDIDGCEQVRISDCDISSGDDAIVLKSTSGHACKNVVITNCLLSTVCNALKIGTETNGSFENIAISNCTIYDTGLAGIALLIVDGGQMERVNISNITMNKVGTPVFIRLGDRGRPIQAGGDHPPVGKLGNVLISNLQADAAGPLGSAISGLPGSPMEQIQLENIRMRYQGGRKLSAVKKEVPELPAEYPEYEMFGQLPAYGLFAAMLEIFAYTM
jgi:polygalacturonase